MLSKRHLRFRLAWLALVLGGCAGRDLPNAMDAGGSASDLSVSMSICPPALPAVGSGPCPTSLVCAYGNDLRVSCRPTALCVDSSWTVSMAVPPSCPLVVCPVPAPSDRDSCDQPEGSVCLAADSGQCVCAPCPPFGPACAPGPLRWFCVPPPTDLRCPRVAPDFGTPCAPEGIMCAYNPCGGGENVSCTKGIWVSAPVACPA